MRSGGNVDGDAEAFDSVGEQRADIPLRAEPQSIPVVQTGGQRLIDEPAATKPS